MDPIIEANNVSLEFALPEQAHESLKSYLLAKVSGHYKARKFLALNDVSFSIGMGEAVGLIGRNGAGKSTLLRLVSGIATPTSGTIAVKGTLAPLLALGNGLDPELTGRENIYLNGAILGYDRGFLKKHEADIVGFSELGQFIDSQVRTYSSGMSMRLAFSIATAAAPDILVLDEVLAVGDAAFQAKCRKRLFEIIDSGTTVFFVSHNPDDVRALCSRAILLDKGEIKMDGDASTVLAKYERMQREGLQG